MYPTIRTLTWHDGALPENEVWLKLAGDKGGDTFKMCFQLCNVTAPNSPDNTCVFSMFEAPDTYTNLLIALKPFMGQIGQLHTQKWR